MMSPQKPLLKDPSVPQNPIEALSPHEIEQNIHCTPKKSLAERTNLPHHGGFRLTLSPRGCFFRSSFPVQVFVFLKVERCVVESLKPFLHHSAGRRQGGVVLGRPLNPF